MSLIFGAVSSEKGVHCPCCPGEGRRNAGYKIASSFRIQMDPPLAIDDSLDFTRMLEKKGCKMSRNTVFLGAWRLQQLLEKAGTVECRGAFGCGPALLRGLRWQPPNMVTCSEYAAAVAFGRSRMLCRRKSPRCRLRPKLRSQDLKSRAKSKRAACPHIRKKSTLRGSCPAFRPLPRSESKAYEPCDLALPAMAMLGAGAVPPGLNGQCMT